MAGLGPVHPGDILREDFLPDYSLSPAALAVAIHVPEPEARPVLDGMQPVTAEMALRLARLFGASAELGLGLQASYRHLATVRRKAGATIIRTIKPIRAS